MVSYSCSHRVGDGEQIGLVARVVVVAEEQRDDAGRGGAHEQARSPGVCASAALQIGDVPLRGAGVAHADRAVAGRRLAARAAGIAEDLPGQRREVDEVLVDEAVAGAAEARQPVLDVGGVARLRHLAVVDDVDAGLDLLADDLGHRRADRARRAPRLDRHAFLLGEHHADEVLRPRQAAGMRGEKALGAAFIVRPSRRSDAA